MNPMALVALLTWNGNPAAAQEQFDEARLLMGRGQAALACPKLERSFALDPALGTLINLADCYEQTGRTASAWVRFREVAAGALRAGQRERAEVARTRAARLEPTLARLRLVAHGDQSTEGYLLRLDGQPIERHQWRDPMPVDPGPHTLEASAPGKLPWQTRLHVLPGPRVVDLVVPPLEEPAPQPPLQGGDVAVAGSSASPSSTRTRWFELAGGGLALAGLAVGAYGTHRLVEAFDRRRERQSYCPVIQEGTAACTDRRGLEAHDAARAHQRSAGLAYALGGALVVGGGLLYFLAPRIAGQAALEVRPFAGGFSLAYRRELP